MFLQMANCGRGQQARRCYGEALLQVLSTLLLSALSAAQTPRTPWGHFSGLPPLLHREVEVCLPST